VSPRAREDSLRPRLQSDACARPLNFTVRPQLIVDAQLIAERINAASALKVGSLRFWGEWFGRPYDAWHKIVRCSADGNTLRLEFHDGGKLTVVDPEDLELSATTFAIRNAAAVRWEWFYYGRPQTAENLYFYEYKRSGAKIDATTNVDWYDAKLSPNAVENAVEIL
jgi:hypothetical protein